MHIHQSKGAPLPSTVVGLDIGRTAVRAVELRQHGKHQSLRRHGSIAIARGTVESGVVADPDEVTAACRRLWKEHRFSSREVRSRERSSLSSRATCSEKATGPRSACASAGSPATSQADCSCT